MYVILSYDIQKKRNGKVLKTCRKYLRHVHLSVFEGELTERKLEKLKAELVSLIKPKLDSVRIYRIPSTGLVTKDVIGMVEDLSQTI